MTEVRPVFVLGTGGLAREMAQLVQHAQASAETRWRFAGFVAEDTAEIGRDLGLGRIVGDDAWLLDQNDNLELVVGIGRPGARASIVQRLRAAPQQFRFPNVIHPSVVIDLDVVALGVGNCITAGCIFTTDIRVGDFNLFNLNVTVGHDAQIGSCNVINPGANVSGGVSLGDRILVGTGSQILENRNVGSGATIGAGAVVTNDVPGDTTVVGVPARRIETR